MKNSMEVRAFERYIPLIAKKRLAEIMLKKIAGERIIDCLGLISLFFWFPERCLWASACSISAIGEFNGKSHLAKYFQNSYALESYGG